jgi:hypothetical protein
MKLSVTVGIVRVRVRVVRRSAGENQYSCQRAHPCLIRNTSGASVKTYIVGLQITSEIKYECFYGASWTHSRLKEHSLAKILSIRK